MRWVMLEDPDYLCVGSIEMKRFLTSNCPSPRAGMASVHSSKSVSLTVPIGRERRRHARFDFPAIFNVLGPTRSVF